MAYRVVVIENNQDYLRKMLSLLKQSPEFTVVASYEHVNAAISQSGMFDPNLFLINVDDKESLDMIPAFVDLFPNADILGVVSKWKADASKQMQRVKTLGCVLMPTTVNEILEALRIYKVRGQKGLARIIAFFSPKGRAGRTTMIAALALELAAHSGERVAIIDADLQFGDIPIFFDVEPKYTAVDAAQDVKSLTPINVEPYFYHLKKNLYMLSSPDRPELAELIEIDRMVDFVRMSCNVFRYVLIDLPVGFNPLSIGLSRLADTIVVMAMLNKGFEIQHVKRTLELMDSHNDNSQKTIYPIFSRVNPCTEEEKIKIEKQLNFPVRNIIPNEYRVVSIANSGRLLKGLPMDSLFMQSIGNIADEIISGKW